MASASERPTDHPEKLPALHPASQRFRDPELERRYRETMRREGQRSIQISIVLAVLLFLLFGLFDVLLGVERLVLTLSVRAVVIGVALTVLALLPLRFSHHHQEAILYGFCMVMTVGLGVIVAVVEPAIADRYYVGFVLIIVASYLIIGIDFIAGSVVAAANIATWLAVSAWVHGPVDLGTLTDMTFLLSSVAITAIAAHSLGRQRRMTYYHAHLLRLKAAASQHSALHDPLTGLPNRRLFMERLARATARDTRFERFAAVLYVDLDDLKKVNDRLGHAAGDELLKAVAERLRSAVRDTDTVARLGGDEFVVLLEDLEARAQVEPALHHMEDALFQPLLLEGERVEISASIGIAVHPLDGDNAEDVLAFADKAMYAQKTQRRRAAAT